MKKFQSTLTNLTGDYAKTGINFAFERAYLELAPLFQAVSTFNPAFKKDILSKFTFYPLKDFELAGTMAIKDTKFALAKEENNFILNLCLIIYKQVKKKR